MASEFWKLNPSSGTDVLGAESAGINAALLCNAMQSGTADSHGQESLTSYLELVGDRAPALWLDFIGSLQNPLADRSTRTTNGLEAPGFLPVLDLIDLQVRVDASSHVSPAPFDDAPLVVAELQGFPTLLVGDPQDPAVVQVGTWIDLGALQSPILQALRLSSWLNRLVVPDSVFRLSSRFAGEHVLSAPPIDTNIDGLGQVAAQLLEDLDLGERPGECVTLDSTAGPLDSLNGTRTQSVARGELPPLNFRYSDAGLAGDYFDGAYLQNPLALLIVIARLTARAIATGTPILDTLGILCSTPGEISDADAAKAWAQITEAKDLDAVVSDVTERLSRIDQG